MSTFTEGYISLVERHSSTPMVVDPPSPKSSSNRSGSWLFNARQYSVSFVYFGIYLLSSLVTFASFFAVNRIFLMTGRFEVFIKVLLEYNSPTVIVASTALFLFFRTITIPDGFFSKIILFVSPLTFGVYLLHEQFLLRSLWVDFWKTEEAFLKPWFILHYIGCVCAVFIIGAVVEWIRKTLFDLIYKLKPCQWFFGKLGKLDCIFPEKDEDFQ